MADSFDRDAWQGHFSVASLAWSRQIPLVDIVVATMPLGVFEVHTVAIEGRLMDGLTLNAALGLLDASLLRLVAGQVRLGLSIV